MGPVILDYAPGPKRSLVRRLWCFIWRWWWVAACVGLTGGLLPFLEPLFQKPHPVYASTGEEYWNRMLKNPIFDACEIRRTGNEVIYAYLDQHGPIYFRADAKDVAEKQPRSLEDLAGLEVLEVDDVAKKWLPYLKAVTGKDFGRNEHAWSNWIDEHSISSWDENTYRKMMWEKSAMYRALGERDPMVIEALVGKSYALKVEERGHFTWRIGISLTTYLAATALVIRFRNFPLRRTRP